MPKIAIIDDDASVGRAFHLLLTSAGLETVVFSTVGAFMESWKTVMCDCIITDLYMPVLSGFDLLERLHGQADCPPIIVVTAFNTSANRERAHRLGARGFFAKPIDDQALLDAIHWAIEEDDPENFEPQKHS